jgi:hypothetical protein
MFGVSSRTRYIVFSAGAVLLDVLVRQAYTSAGSDVVGLR